MAAPSDPLQRHAVFATLTGSRASLAFGELAALVALSEFHFARMFRVSFGMPPHAWILQARLERARQLLAEPGSSLHDVAARAGFASASHLSHRFRAAFGVTPGTWRAGSSRSACSPPGLAA